MANYRPRQHQVQESESDLIDLELVVEELRDKSIRVRDLKGATQFLPRSVIELQHVRGRIYIVTMPQHWAEEKGLV